jgi:hypothetical protein
MCTTKLKNSFISLFQTTQEEDKCFEAGPKCWRDKNRRKGKKKQRKTEKRIGRSNHYFFCLSHISLRSFVIERTSVTRFLTDFFLLLSKRKREEKEEKA